MTDCAMMGRDWRTVTYWEWQALLWNWNDRHNPDGNKPQVQMADPAKVRAAVARLRDRAVKPRPTG